MKRILAFLLALALCLPLCASASRERIFDLTEETLTALHTRYDALLEQTLPGEPYPACTANLTERERLLFVVLTYDAYLRSAEGLCGFLLDEPAMLPDLYAGLQLIGDHHHAEFLQNWLTNHPACTAWHFGFTGSISRSWAHDWYGFADFDAAAQSGHAEALAMYLARFILEEEPLWHEDYAVSLTLSENVLHSILARVTDGPWPECAAALSEDERALFLAWNFFLNLECGGLCTWLINTEPAMLADTPAALSRVDGSLAYKSQLSFFLEEAGLDLTDPAALAPFHTGDMRDRIALPDQYPFSTYDQQLEAIGIVFPFQEVLNEFIRRNPESFR